MLSKKFLNHNSKIKNPNYIFLLNFEFFLFCSFKKLHLQL